MHPRRRTARWLAIVAALVLVVGACGDDDDGDGGTASPTSVAGGQGTTTSAGPATTAEPDDFDPAGVLRVGDLLAATGGGINFDPINNTAYASWRYMKAIYGSLLTRNADGSYRPDLATDWEIVDPRTVELDLREGVQFQDGTPFDAEAVRFNLIRARDAAAQSFSFSAELKLLDDVEIVDAHKVRLKLREPVAGWLFSAGRPFFSSPETLMPSPAAVQAGLATKPVGAGAFEFVSYTPESELVLQKSDTYWDADNVRLAEVRFVYVAPGPAQSLALRSGEVDIIANLSSSQVPEIESVDDLEVEATVTGRQFWAIYFCKAIPPFDDVRIRKALNYAIDREAIIAAAFRGFGEPIDGLLPEGHPFHVPELDDHFAYDPDRARQLLAEAGAENVEFTLMYSPSSVPGDTIAEILRSQLAEVGMTVNFRPVQNLVAEFFAVPNVANGALTPGNDYGITDLTPGGIGNACAYDNPTLNALVADIKAALPDSDEQYDLIAEYQRYIVEDEALVAWLVWTAEVFGWQDERVDGVDYQLGPFPAPRELLLSSLYIER